MIGITIRPLYADVDTGLVLEFYEHAPDYLLMAEGRVPGPTEAKEFFTNGPPGCDPSQSYRLGYFTGDQLSGVAEVSFGFPNQTDAYLGLMVLGPWARGEGHGPVFLAEVERLARERGATALYLAVLAANPRGRAFWERAGFVATGDTGTYDIPGATHHLTRMIKTL